MPLPLVGGGEQDMLSYSSQHPSSRNDVFSSHTGNVDSFYGPNVRQHSNARSCLNVNNLNAKPSSTAAPSVVNVFGRDEALLFSSSSSHNAQFNSQPLGFDNNTHLNNAVKTNHLDSGGFENVFSGGKDFNSVAESKSFSSSSFVSGVKSGHPTSKPRLTKVRRNANVSKGKATAQADNNTSRIESSGYNPLKSGISIKSKENQELRFTGSSTPSGFNVFDQSSKDETAMAALFKATKPSEHATSSVQFDKFFKQKPSVVQTEQSKVTYESVTGKGENEVLNQSHLSNNFKPLLHGNGNFKFDPGSYKKNEKVHNCNDFSQGSIPKQTETSYTFLNHEMKENNNNRGGDDRASNTAAKADKEYESKSFKQSDLVKDSKEELQARLRSWTPFSEFSSSDCSIGNSLSSSINKRDNSIFIFKGNLKDNSHANRSGKQDFHILRKSENTAFAKSKESSDFTFTFGRNMENLSNVSSGITTGAFKSEKFNVSDKSNGVFCFKSTSDALGTEKGQFERVREELQSRMKTWCPFVDDSKVKTEEGTDDNRHSPPGFVACETTPKENSFTTEPKEGLAAGDNTINTVMNSGHVTTRNDSNFSMPNRIFVDQEAASHGSFVFTSLAEEKDKSTLRSRENLEGYNSGSNDNGSFVFGQQSGIRKTASKNNKLESKSSGINSCVGIKNPFNLQKPHLGSSTGEKDGESKSESLSHSERLRLNKAANLCDGDHDTNFSAVALNKERIECENIGSAAHPMESSNVCEDSSTAYQQFPPGSFKETLNMASSGYSGIADARETKFKCEGTSVHNENSWPYRDENSWPFLQNLSASLNRIFEFNAARDSRQTNLSRKKRGKSHLPSSFQRRSAQHSTYTRPKRSEAASTLGHESGEGSPMDFSPYGETTASNESTSYCHGVFDAEKSSVPSTSSVPCSSHVNVNAYMSTDLEVKVEELRAAAVKLQIGTEGKPFEHKNMEKGSTGIESQNFQTKNDFNLNKAEHSNPGNDNQQQTINGVSFQHFQMNGGFNVNKTERFISKTHSQKQTNEEETSLPSSESEWLKSKMEQIKIEQSENSAGVKSEENNQNKRFTFVASPASNSMPVSNRRQFRRIYRPKVRGASHASNTDLKFVFPSPSFGVQGAILQQDAVPSEKDNHKFNSQTLGEAMDARDQSNVIVSQGLEKAGAMSESSQQPEERVAMSSLRVAMSAKAEQACEKWRLRGNQAYANRDFPRAEDCYSRGASIVSVDETSRSCKRAAMLCYSNRAATRMAMGRLREALTDCKQAMAIDPKFLRVQLRAASCHLILGEYEEAIILFNQCRHSAKGMETSDLKIASEASEGLRKAQQGLDYVNHVGKLVETKRQDDLTNALQILNEALSVSPQAECLLHMKVSTLLSLQKYEEVIQVCEQSLDDAERNVCIESLDIQQGSSCLNEGSAKLSVKLWRWHMCAKANFYLGRLEETIEILSKYESAHSSLERARKESMESLSLFTAKVRDLLKHKYAGNKAFQEGKHAEAVEHYTAALSCNGDSRPFTAVCFCNRAAASQALGHVTDAIADCSRAIALDPNYPKAISRRATLHELVHDYAHACVDLQRLMNLLENQQQSKSHCSGKGKGSSNITQDLRQVRERLAKVQEEMKARNQLDHYLILGVEASSTTADIKKAYRKAALRHHPDKAGQFLSRSDEGGDTYWKEIEEEVRRDAERLFKMIGEAYTVLSDPGKRMQYDNEEELRKLRKRGTGSGSEGVEVHYYRYEQPSRWHRNRWGSFWEDAFENPHQRWQKYSDASQQDAYTRRTASSYRNSYRSRWTDWD